MTPRVTAVSEPRFADRLRSAGQDVPVIPTRRPAPPSRDRLTLSQPASHPGTAKRSNSLWDSLTAKVSGLLPSWMRPAPKATSSKLTVKRVGSGIHIIGALPVSARQDHGGLDPQAKASFERMKAAAARAGITLRVSSSYRSVSQQRQLFSRSDGSGHWVAKPGYSEHHTGLAFDIATPGYSGGKKGNFQKSPAYRWLQEHGYEYGFVQSMTWESWHWHYDPQAVAKAQGR